jgi:hypothetical protein
MAASTLLSGYAISIAIVVGAGGLSALVLGVLCVRFRSRQVLAGAGAVAALVAAGAGAAGLSTGSLSGLNPLICGIVSAILFTLMLPFMVDADKAEFFNKSGGELAVVNSVRPKGDALIAKAVLLGAMPETIYIRPGELCRMIALLDDKVILGIVGTLYRGWRQNRSRRSAS